MADNNNNKKVGFLVTANDAFARRINLEKPTTKSLGQKAGQLEVLNVEIDLDQILTGYFSDSNVIATIGNIYDELAPKYYTSEELTDTLKTTIINNFKTILTTSVESVAEITELWFGQDCADLDSKLTSRRMKVLFDGRSLNQMGELYVKSYDTNIARESNTLFDAGITNHEYATEVINKLLNTKLPDAFAKLIYTLGGFVFDFGIERGTHRRSWLKFHFKVNNKHIYNEYRTKTPLFARLSDLSNTRDNLISKYPILTSLLAAFDYNSVVISVNIPGTDSYIIRYKDGLNFSRADNAQCLHLLYMADQSLKRMINESLVYATEGENNGYRDDLMPEISLLDAFVQTVAYERTFNGDAVLINALESGIYEDIKIYFNHALKPMNVAFDVYNIDLDAHTETYSYKLVLPYDLQVRGVDAQKWIYAKGRALTPTPGSVSDFQDDLDTWQDFMYSFVDKTWEVKAYADGCSWRRPTIYQDSDGVTIPGTLNFDNCIYPDVVWPGELVVPDSTMGSVKINAYAEIFKLGYNLFRFKTLTADKSKDNNSKNKPNPGNSGEPSKDDEK